MPFYSEISSLFVIFWG